MGRSSAFASPQWERLKRPSTRCSDGCDRALDLQDRPLAAGNGHDLVEHPQGILGRRHLREPHVGGGTACEYECGSAEHAVLRAALGVVALERLKRGGVVEIAAKLVDLE